MYIVINQSTGTVHGTIKDLNRAIQLAERLSTIGHTPHIVYEYIVKVKHSKAKGLTYTTKANR